MKKGSIVRVKEEYWNDYAIRVYRRCGKYFVPEIHGMVIDVTDDEKMALVNWMPLGYYPLNDPLIAIDTEWLEED